MFLSKTIERNPDLIRTAVTLHQQGLIPAGSYLIDLDTVAQNARLMKEKADSLGLKIFAMTKQIGRNPAVIRTLMDAGIDSAVCVDMADARRVHEAGMKIGHLGHLVQVPMAETAAAVAMEPEYWTVYSLEKARQISQALPAGREQKILLRVYDEGDTFYTGHEGGFPAGEIRQVIAEIQKLPGLRFAGLSTFPTQLFDPETVTVRHTHNYETLKKLKQELEQEGYGPLEINAPGTTSSHLFEEMAASGATQVEPGHGLTGTTPIHALRDMAEKPAMVYVSEVSHFYKDRGYCYGGGMYIDPVFPPYEVRACVGKDPDTALSNLVPCDIPAPSAIDYYGILAANAPVQADDTVVFGFRAQIFVTRAFVVPVSGIADGKSVVQGIYDSDGKKMGWPHC